jgi:hypothetical protein
MMSLDGSEGKYWGWTWRKEEEERRGDGERGGVGSEGCREAGKEDI